MLRSIELFSRVGGGFRSRCLLDHNEALFRLSYVHQGAARDQVDDAIRKRSTS